MTSTLASGSVQLHKDNRVLREIECQVLDRHHQSMKLLQRNANDAITGLLRCYGEIHRGLSNGFIPKNSEDARQQTVREATRGLAHCLRWIRSRCPRLIAVPSPTNASLDSEALDLLRWGVEYDSLYNQHTAYSRKISGTRFVEATVDEAERTITFLPREDIDRRFFVSQVEAKKTEDARQASLYPDHQLAELSAAWFQSVHSGQVGIQFDDSTIASSGALNLAIDWLRATCLPELRDNELLGIFTAASLRRVLAAIHVASLFRVRLEDCSERQHAGNGPRVLTHVLSWSIDELVEWLHTIAGVDRRELRGIFPLLTFDSEPNHVTCAHKPFVLGADDRIFLSPRLFLSVPLSQMVVGSLNLSPASRAAYDSVSNSIEKRVVAKLAEEVRAGCLADARVISNKTYDLPDSSKIAPDFMLLSADGTELLVVDVKNATPPFGVGDIANDLKEWSEEWVPQLTRYAAAFADHPEILSQHFPNCQSTSRSVFALILLRWPFPIPATVPDNIGAIDWPTRLDNLSSESDTRSIGELYEWIRQRPDVSVVESLGWNEKSLKVGEWTYKYSVLSPTRDH